MALRPLIETYGENNTHELDIEKVTEVVRSMRGKSTMFLRVLKIFARYCFWAKIETINPNLINTKRVYDPTEQPFLEEEDVEAMCTVCDDDTFLGVRNQLIIKMLFDTGIRLSELLDIQLADVDAQQNAIKIITKKSKINRYIMWSESTHKLLQTYLGMRVSRDWSAHALFINKHGSLLTKRGVEYMFNKVSEQTLGEKHHPHECRHGKAHHLLRDKYGKGTPTLLQMALILGHKNLQSVMTYTRLHARESLELVKRYI